MVKKVTSIIGIGKRKTAIARAVIKNGTGRTRINKQVLQNFSTPFFNKLLLRETLELASDRALKVNINVNVKGGGTNSQIQAIRTAIGDAMLKFYKNDEDLRKTFVEHDRSIIVSDTRRKEMNKPYRSKARSRRQKSKR